MHVDLLKNHVGGQWIAGHGDGIALRDAVLGNEVARVSSAGIDLPAAYRYARETGGAALRALTHAQRARLLADVAAVLQQNRDAYYDISMQNSGTVRNDSAVDIDGGLYTLNYYAKAGAALGQHSARADGDAVSLAKDKAFQSQHVMVPTRGLALLINAFNFPSWGFLEKAAPAWLAGVPLVVKPATATAWLTHQMVKDILDAKVLPEGALSIVCGSSDGLLDPLSPFDVVSFTGSAATASVLRRHAAFADRSVRLNAETDSLNSAILGPDAAPGTEAFDALVREVVREMTVKSGQKCTAIRRILVPQAWYDETAQAIAARLAKTTVGNPRNESVRMGSLVGRAQYDTVQAGLRELGSVCDTLFDGSGVSLVDADPAVAACVAPHLFGTRDADANDVVHDLEVFGPVATLMPYRDAAHANDLARRGHGSLVTSLYSADTAYLVATALDLADSHGRVHVITPDVAKVQTGHGNVMPQSLHGGPGRAGGGEELGGLRALGLYQRRAAIQASPDVVAALFPAEAADASSPPADRN